jgi:hypothetical protein
MQSRARTPRSTKAPAPVSRPRAKPPTGKPSPSPSPSTELAAFSQRLRRAVLEAGYAASPTVIAHEFNLRYWGKGVTVYAARNWLLGTNLPTQDKLRVLAQWLKVSPQELRYGEHRSDSLSLDKALKLAIGQQGLSLQDRELIVRYLHLPKAKKLLVRELVGALVGAA